MNIQIQSVSNSNGTQLATELTCSTAPLAVILNQSAATSEPRLAGIDSIRFWLAIWVYFSHFGIAFLPDHGTSFFIRATAGVFNNLFNGAAAVIGFFIISGLCIHYPYRNATTISVSAFYVRRYVRILVPLIAAVGLGRLMGSDLVGFYRSILWSLIAELVYYTIYPALRPAFNKPGFTFVLGVAFLVSTALVISQPHAMNYHEFGPYLTWIVGLPAWLLGCSLAASKELSKPISTPVIWAWRLGLLGLAALASILRFHAGVGYPITLTILAPLLYLWLRREIAWHHARGTNRIFEYCGQFSYSIYLMHGLAVATLTILIRLSNPMLLVPVQLLFVFGFSYLFFLGVEKPGHRLARYLAHRIAVHSG